MIPRLKPALMAQPRSSARSSRARVKSLPRAPLCRLSSTAPSNGRPSLPVPMPPLPGAHRPPPCAPPPSVHLRDGSRVVLRQTSAAQGRRILSSARSLVAGRAPCVPVHQGAFGHAAAAKDRQSTEPQSASTPGPRARAHPPTSGLARARFPARPRHSCLCSGPKSRQPAPPRATPTRRSFSIPASCPSSPVSYCPLHFPSPLQVAHEDQCVMLLTCEYISSAAL